MEINLKIGKKGDYTLGHKIFYAIVFVVVVALIFSYAHALFTNYRFKSVDNSLEIEAIILANLLVSDPDCYAYYDEDLGRCYPGIIDFVKTYRERDMEKCLKYLPEGYRVDIFLDEFGTLYSNALPEEESKAVVEKNVLVKSDTATLPTILVVRVYHDQFLQENMILEGKVQ